MREAYDWYATQVPQPMRFDSFRRVIAEGRIVSRKDGHWKHVQKQALEAYVRVYAQPFEDHLGVWIEDLLERSGGLPDQQSYLVCVHPEGAQEVGCAPFILGEGPRTQELLDFVTGLEPSKSLLKDSLAVSGDPPVYAHAARWCLVVLTWKNLPLMQAFENAVRCSVMGRLADSLVAQGVLDVVKESVNLEERLYQRAKHEV